MPGSANDNDRDAKPEASEPTGRPCSICGKPALMRYKPFCSRRCADVDLGRWLSGTYAVPAPPEDDDENDERPEDPRER